MTRSGLVVELEEKLAATVRNTVEVRKKNIETPEDKWLDGANKYIAFWFRGVEKQKSFQTAAENRFHFFGKTN